MQSRWTGACRALAQADPALGDAIKRVGPCQLELASYASTFEALARSITYQQLSGKAAGTIYQRFVNRYGNTSGLNPQRVARAQIRGLRGVGLSRSKADYIRGLARSYCQGDLPAQSTLEAMRDEHVVEALVRHRGVGEWTVQMLLMFWLGRPDVLAGNDLGLQKGIAVIDGMTALPSPAQVVSRGEVWRPWRSVASWYLWRVADE